MPACRICRNRPVALIRCRPTGGWRTPILSDATDDVIDLCAACAAQPFPKSEHERIDVQLRAARERRNGRLDTFTPRFLNEGTERDV